MKNIICKLFGHKWICSKTSYIVSHVQYFRNCKRCGVIEEYRESVPHYGNGWFRLVQFTKNSAKNLSTELRRNK